MALWLQVGLSFFVCGVVIFLMWRIPRRGDALFDWAPPLALISVWAGLIALCASATLWVLSAPDPWIASGLLFLDPGAIGAGVLVLWIYRRYDSVEHTVGYQILQAKVGITLGLVAVAMGYLFIFTHKPPGTVVGILP